MPIPWLQGPQESPSGGEASPLSTLAATVERQGWDPAALLLNEAALGALTVLVKAALILVLGLAAVFGMARWLRGWVGTRYSAQRGMVAGKVVYYLGTLVVLVSVLSELGFSLAPLLGAAGILGIAIGFASQTSVSNVISGVFLIAEQPFQVDDIIQVGQTSGRVLSIDMLSVKLRTFDNRFIRIPNETIIKSEVVTLTRFPIRRIDLVLGVAYREEMARVRTLLLDVAARNRLILMEPEPQVLYDGFGNSSVDMRLVAWATRENFFSARNSLTQDVKGRLDAEGVEIPFPHLSLYSGSVTDPFPVRVVSPHREEGEPDAAPEPHPGAPEEEPPPTAGEESGEPPDTR